MKDDSSKTTILVISIGFLILYLLFSWEWTVYLSLIIGLTGIFSHYLSIKIEWVWLKMSGIIGHIVPLVLLCILYFLVLCPIALLSRRFRKDPLMLSGKYSTYFIDINKEPDMKSFEKLW